MAMMSTTVDAVRVVFTSRDYSITSPLLASKLLSLCVNYSLSPSLLVDEYESLAITSAWDTALTDARIDALAAQLMRMQAKRTLPKTPVAAALKNKNAFGASSAIKGASAVAIAIDAELPNTPAAYGAKKTAASVAQLTPMTPTDAIKLIDQDRKSSGQQSAFKTRTEPGKELATYGSNDAGSVSKAPVVLVVDANEKKAKDSSARYMYEKVEDRANAIGTRIRRFAERVKERLVPDEGEEGARVKLDPVGAARQTLVRVVGRICIDAEGANGGRLNENSLMLEGDVKTSSGARVKLDVSSLDKISLFPGQVVYVEGFNLSGFTLVATRLVSCVESMALPSTGDEAVKMDSDGADGDATANDDKPRCPGGARIAVASGPFTCTCDSSYEPLEELLAQFDGQSNEVDALVLVGPFVDAEHPSVAGNALPITFEELFAAKPRAMIEAFTEKNAQTTVIVIPSVRDVCEPFVFPQPPMEEGKVEGAVAAPNPATLDVEGLRIAVSSVDAMKHLAGAELGRGYGAGADRLARLAAHCISQRLAYPIFPSPRMAGLPLDVAMAEEKAQISGDVDVLLMPSDLAPLAKAVDASALLPVAVAGDAKAETEASVGGIVPSANSSVLAVNPGRTARGTGGGSYARIMVSAGETPVRERLTVRIIRV
ncbi:DNA polymerase alpha subunit B [Pycnococcus provasolii]|uniref:DNA polymerase alpha subunit B n=2 Tax=Pycnococcus provasolii TaxID=41880 RepID=A0A830HTY7_9CHLO|nr:DNA polymerase alpha subunit B [Pycnococcus provasolii]